MADTTFSHKLDPPKLAPSSLSSIGKPVYLELCIKSAPGTERLAEITIVDGMGQQLINTDAELFASIRKAYNSTKREGLFRIFAFLFWPDDIRYVLFAMHNGRPIIWESAPMHTPSIPPRVEVDEKRYHYSDECDHVFLPPMPRNNLLQYYRQLEKCDPGDAFFLKCLPKKLGASMTVPSKKNPGELECGWGIHIIEGPNTPVLAALYASFLFLGLTVAIGSNTWVGTPGLELMFEFWIVATLPACVLYVAFYYDSKGY
jgi:hypothetical protein